MYLGIEIGGTKLQLGVGPGNGSEPAAIERLQVDPQRHAAGILEQIERTAGALLSRHDVSRIGIGFGGPVNRRSGRVTRSHQISGWDDFPLVEWCSEKFGLPAMLSNDCDAAAVAEARYGAGRGRRSVLFVTVGTGVGGGLVFDGELFGTERPAAAEIGHLRPGLDADCPHASVESFASGAGIEEAARGLLEGSQTGDALELLLRCDNDLDRLTAKSIGEAAAEGNTIACKVLEQATRTLGWAIAQAITLTAVEVVIVGGGVSLMDASLFLEPLRRWVDRYVFPPLAAAFEVVPAKLGELVVVHGALVLASDSETNR